MAAFNRRGLSLSLLRQRALLKEIMPLGQIHRFWHVTFEVLGISECYSGTIDVAAPSLQETFCDIPILESPCFG